VIKLFINTGSTCKSFYVFFVCFLPPLFSIRQHYEIDDCLEDNREDY